MLVPLHLRAPNPPVPFVGRLEDLSWLAQPRRVSVVVGPEGLGRSSLVAAHLATPLATSPPRLALRIDAGARSNTDLIARAIRGLAATLGFASSDLARATGDEERIAQLVDLLDGADAILWLDHVGPEDAALAGRLLGLVARYGRRGDVIATAHEAFDEVPPSHQHRLGPLDSEALASLARAIDPSLEPRQAARLARSAAGSPGRLHRLHRAVLGEPESDALSAEAVVALALLRAVRAPIAREALVEVTGEAAILELIQRGAIAGPMHALRALPGEAEPVPPAAAAALAGSLTRLGGSEARLAALRLWLALDEVGHAQQLLADSIGGLVSEGYAPELWELLSPRTEAVLGPYRLRAAAEHGDPEALRNVVDPGPDAPLDHAFGWLKVRYAREDFATVRARGRALAERADAERAVDLSWEIWAMTASAAMAAGDFDGAAELIDRARPTLEAEALSVRAVRAIVAARRGDRAEASALAGGLEKRLGELAGRERANLTFNLALVLYGLGEPGRAGELFSRTFPIDDLSTAALLPRRALEMDAHLSVLGGRLPRARALLDRLEKFVVPGTPIEGRRTLIEGTLALLEGRLEDAARQSEQGIALATRYQGDEDRAYGVTLAAQVAWRRGVSPAPLGERPHGLSGRLAMAWHAIAEQAAAEPAARGLRDEAEPAQNDGTPPITEPTTHTELSVTERALALLHRVRTSIANGGEGSPELTHALRALVEDGARLGAVPARSAIQLLAHELSILAGAWPTLPGEVPMLEATQRLTQACEGADVATLAALADQASGLPAAAARALLGGPAPSGFLARALVTAMGARLGWQHVKRAGAPGPTLYFDAPRAVLVAPGEATIDLGAYAVPVELLRALVHHGPALDKETLVRTVWKDVREYHPLHHDNRLRLAVRKLRARLGSLELISTRPDGYALARELVWLGP
jgi:hypothetical protein